MEIKLHNGKRDVILRGEDGQFTLSQTTGNEDKSEKWRTVGYFSTIEGAMTALLRLKISNSDATTLAELQAELKKLKDELIFAYQTGIENIAQANED